MVGCSQYRLQLSTSSEKAMAPTPVLLPGKSHGWESLVGCSPWGHKNSDMTEWLSNWRATTVWKPSFHLLVLKLHRSLKAAFSLHFPYPLCCCCCWVTSVVSDTVGPHRQQPTRLPHPWDSPGKNTGVGCHCLLPPFPLSMYNFSSLASIEVLLFQLRSGGMGPGCLSSSLCSCLIWLNYVSWVLGPLYVNEREHYYLPYVDITMITWVNIRKVICKLKCHTEIGSIITTRELFGSVSYQSEHVSYVVMSDSLWPHGP